MVCLPKTVQFKNDTYLDSNGISHEKEILSDILNNSNINEPGYKKFSDGLMIQWRSCK